MANISNDWLYTPMVGVKVMSEKVAPNKCFYDRQFFTDADRRNKLFFDKLDDVFFDDLESKKMSTINYLDRAILNNKPEVDCGKIASLLSEKPMSPYRQLATVEKEEAKPKRTGLLVAEVPHKCNPPFEYSTFTIKKELFGLLKRKIEKKAPMVVGSLYRCPECLKISGYEPGGYWSTGAQNTYKRLWLERTGEVE